MEILLISGSLRQGSTNAAVLRTAGDLIRAAGDQAVTYDGLAGLPHFNPDDDHDPLPPAVVDLRARIEEADAVMFCTPEYAGDLPGSFKNLLDWTVGGMEIEAKPVAWINVSTAPAGAAGTHRALRTVLGYTGGDIVDEACVHVPVPRQAVGPGGVVDDDEIRAAIGRVVAALADHVRRHPRAQVAPGL